jgi:mono/diheme cytochrome c family protein
MSRRERRGRLATTALLAAGLCACRMDMQDQPKYESYEHSAFFADGAALRQPPAHTVPRDPDIPVPALSAALLDRGEHEFEMFCSGCHGLTGEGDGMLVRRGFRRPPSYHEERLRQAPAAHFVDVATNGFGAMPSYAHLVPVQDRWAIAAYIRALQLSRSAPREAVPPDVLQTFATAPQ